ncbi:MAG: enoyl-CoA hydratase/isomerase family protein [Planctomycetota bacterium]
MTLVVHRREEICELRLASPPGNIIDRALCLQLTEAIRAHAADPHLKAFLFTAEGKHFSYGASVPEHVAGKVEEFLPTFHGVFEALMEASVPTLAAVRGVCFGGAFELVAFANYLVAARSATFAVPEIRLGVFPPVACALFPWRLGGAIAEDLILRGRNLTAEEGVRCGLVTQLCDDDELDGAVVELCEEAIRPRSAAVLRLAVRSARAPLYAEMRGRLPELERAYFDELMATRDANEGIRAFLEKRAPTWENA